MRTHPSALTCLSLQAGHERRAGPDLAGGGQASGGARALARHQRGRRRAPQHPAGPARQRHPHAAAGRGALVWVKHGWPKAGSAALRTPHPLGSVANCQLPPCLPASPHSPAAPAPAGLLLAQPARQHHGPRAQLGRPGGRRGRRQQRAAGRGCVGCCAGSARRAAGGPIGFSTLRLLLAHSIPACPAPPLHPHHPPCLPLLQCRPRA